MSSAKNDTTNQIFENAGRGSLELMGSTADMVVVIRNEKGNIIHTAPRSSSYRKTSEFYVELLEDTYQYKLAKRLGVSKAYMSNVITGKDPSPASRDRLLSALLCMKQIPGLEETNDILWHQNRPGLFTETYIPAVNRRNLICSRLIEYAHDNPTAQENWVVFAGNVLSYAGMETLDRKMYPGELGKDLPMVEQWIEEANALPICSFHSLRKFFFDRYCRRLGLSPSEWGSITKGRQQILDAMPTCLSNSTLNDFFAETTNKNSKCSRETIIEIAIAMGCNREEADKMLMQADERLLYPGCKDFLTTQQELRYIEQLNQNALRFPVE